MGWKKISRKIHHDDRPAHKAALREARERKELLPDRSFFGLSI
jgi:hypothetical protein